MLGEEVSLTCPVAGVRMVDPVKGAECVHLGAFERSSLDSLLTSASTGKKICPLCDKEMTTVIDAVEVRRVLIR